MIRKPAKENEQFKYTDVLYYNYFYILSIELQKNLSELLNFCLPPMKHIKGRM